MLEARIDDSAGFRKRIGQGRTTRRFIQADRLPLLFDFTVAYGRILILIQDSRPASNRKAERVCHIEYVPIPNLSLRLFIEVEAIIRNVVLDGTAAPGQKYLAEELGLANSPMRAD